MRPELSHVAFSAAQVSDAGAITGLLIKVQSERSLPLTIWSAPGVSEFVRDIITSSEPQSGMRFYVARLEGEVQGVICLRGVDGKMFLDNIFVTPTLRRMQASNPFILFALEEYAKFLKSDEICWDVWAHDRIVLAWHKQLGGVEQSRRNWYIVPLSGEKRPARAIRISRAMEEQHERYGLSTIEVVTGSGTYSVGRLGTHAFRITDPKALEDAELTLALQAESPERAIYVLMPAAVATPWGEPLVTTIRLAVSMSTVMRRLENRSVKSTTKL